MTSFKFKRDKSADYLEAVEAMRAMPADDAHRAWAEAHSETAKKAWAARHGLTLSTGHPCILRLLGKKCGRNVTIGRSCRPPMADHCSLWLKNGKPYVFVSQPYPSTSKDLAKAIIYAQENGLVLRIGTWPSWHFPGSVLMMEYIKDQNHTGIAVGP